MIIKCNWIFIMGAPGRLFGDGMPSKSASICSYQYFHKLTFLTIDTDTEAYQDERTMGTHRALPDVVLSSFDFPVYQIRNCGCINRWFSLFHLFISSASHCFAGEIWVMENLWLCLVLICIHGNICRWRKSAFGKVRARQLGVTYERAYRMKAIIKYIE